MRHIRHDCNCLPLTRERLVSHSEVYSLFHVTKAKTETAPWEKWHSLIHQEESEKIRTVDKHLQIHSSKWCQHNALALKWMGVYKYTSCEFGETVVVHISKRSVMHKQADVSQRDHLDCLCFYEINSLDYSTRSLIELLRLARRYPSKWMVYIDC